MLQPAGHYCAGIQDRQRTGGAVQEAWEKRLDKFVDLWDGPITIEQVENVSTAIVLEHAESEFEKYRIVLDRLFMSDYDRYLLVLEEEAQGNGNNA